MSSRDHLISAMCRVLILAVLQLVLDVVDANGLLSAVRVILMLVHIQTCIMAVHSTELCGASMGHSNIYTYISVI